MGDMDKEVRGCQTIIGLFILAIFAAGILVGSLIMMLNQ